jgi:putative membrane protein
LTASVSNRTVFSWSFLISGIIIGFLLWLIYFKGAPDKLSTATSVLPVVNALLNGLSACFLIGGYVAIKKRRVSIHKRFMLGALVSSALFLITYVIYHNAHGDTPFQGAGFIRLIYFFILISHILLTAVALPLILVTFFFAFTSNFDAHRKIARITFPAWLYVSVTGVMIFFLLKIFS